MSMWKQRLKHTAAALADNLGVWTLLDRAHRDIWTIVCYHRVLPADKRARYFCPDLVVTPDALHAHCAVYREHFEVLTVRDAFARMHSGTPLTKPLLSLSFDDGYRDNFEFAAPILAEHGLPASFYVVAGLVDKDFLPWYDEIALTAQAHPELHMQGRPLQRDLNDPAYRRTLARLVVEEMKGLRTSDVRELLLIASMKESIPPEDPSLDLIMTSKQVCALHAAGHEIGSHSMLHPILTRVAPEELPNELGGARAHIESLLSAPVTTFCYPNGDFNDEILTRTREAGYTAALSTAQGLNDRFSPAHALRRVFINENWLSTPDGSPSPPLLRAELALLHRFRA